MLLAAAFCVPAHSQLNLGEAFPAARDMSAKSREVLAEIQRKADDAEFKKWGIDPQLLFLTHRNQDCIDADCIPMRRALVDALRAVPPFLRTNDLQMIFWDDPGDEGMPEGQADGEAVSITASTSKLQRVLVHELAHHYDEHNGEVTGIYLNIRFAKQPLWNELDALWKHIREKKSAGRPKIDDYVRAELRRLRVPRRDDDDVHLTGDYYEYWAGSVELYWLDKGDRKALQSYLIDDEIDFLKKLFESPERSATRHGPQGASSLPSGLSSSCPTSSRRNSRRKVW